MTQPAYAFLSSHAFLCRVATNQPPSPEESALDDDAPFPVSGVAADLPKAWSGSLSPQLRRLTVADDILYLSSLSPRCGMRRCSQHLLGYRGGPMSPYGLCPVTFLDLAFDVWVAPGISVCVGGVGGRRG